MSKTPEHPSTRREFFIDTVRRAGTTGLTATLLLSVQRASAIEAPVGSTYLDAEHIVILMQENRSFDHAFGTLRGVRGFNDPRAVTLPNQNPVWLQSNKAGETYAPFRLNIRETNATWLGGLPHSWRDQNDAKSHGNHDGWLDAKPSGHKDVADKPFTMGHYERSDLPFYYALADAFTICDQNFCSSQTGTTPNRLYLFTGTIREKQDPASPANVRNSDVDYPSMQKWPTFPERLEDAGVSWKIYQNEISLPTGLTGEEDAWLANFTDNPIEWFEQFQGRFSKTHRAWAEKAVVTLPKEIADLNASIAAANPTDATRLTRERRSKESQLRTAQEAQTKYTDAAWAALPQRARSLHEKAFTINSADSDWRQLTALTYKDGSTERQVKAPKGDVFHQFRKDVREGKLPTVSWLVPPENLSDHPGAPWYGAWTVSEVLNILTQNPDVWKKTIFVLTYDENDGYFDHVVPFAAPDPARPETGKTSEGLDTAVEFWPIERDREKRSVMEARGGSIGLGFRVPMVIASPWSRGGYVCSQVFDHTSVLQLVENVLTHKTGKEIRETNISTWRRVVCGDLSSVFQPASSAETGKLDFPPRDTVLEGIHKAQFRQLPSGYRKLSAADIAQFRENRFSVPWMPRQEPGIRTARPLPYQLEASGKLSADAKFVEITMETSTGLFGAKSAGSPFHVYAPQNYRHQPILRTRAYAVAAGKRLTDTWDIAGFENGIYHLSICGPNGFLRELTGDSKDPELDIRCEYSTRTPGDLDVIITATQSHQVRIIDNAYGSQALAATVSPGVRKVIPLKLAKSHSWYDFTIKLAGNDTFFRRHAGRVETTKPGYSDPAMAGAKA